MEQEAGQKWQGAEAIVTLCTLDNQKIIRKHRFPKAYRHPELDKKLTRQRTAQEARCLARASRAGIPCPAVFSVIPDSGTLLIEFIDGVKVKEAIDKELLHWEEAGKRIGCLVAQLHLAAGIVHGDLTTSNMLWSVGSQQLYLIDFGLASMSLTVEDRAVDLYVLERAVLTTHGRRFPGLFERILSSYYDGLPEKVRMGVKTRFEQVQQRGRKRE